MLLLLTLAAAVAVQLIAIVAAYGLRSRERQLRRQLPYLVSLAVGVLVATALLHLLPEAVDALGNRRGVWLAAGLTSFVLFSLERMFVAWTRGAASPSAEVEEHPHGPACAHMPGHTRALRPMNLVMASSLHSFVDGAAIATAFLVSARLGLLTAAAVALHEVPHRVGDLAVLLHLGLTPSRAMRYAVLAGAPAVVGALLVMALGEANAGVFRWLLPVSAGSFLYIAAVNLLPEIQTDTNPRTTALQLLCLGSGVAVVLLATGVHAG